MYSTTRKALTGLILVSIALTMNAQRGIWERTVSPGDSARFLALQSKAESFYRKNIDSARYYGMQVMQLGMRTRHSRYIAAGAYTLGTSWDQAGQTDSAIHYLEIAFIHYQKTDSAQRVAVTAEELASRYLEIGRHKIALDRLGEAMAFADSSGDSATLSKVLHRQAGVFLYLKQHEKTIEFSRRSMAINEARNFPLGVSANLNSIGNAHRELGRADSAMHYFRQSLAIKEALKDARGIATVISNIALLETDVGHYDRADSLLLEAERRYLEVRMLASLPVVKINRGYNFILMGVPERAVPLLEAALAAPSVRANPANKAETHLNLARALSMLERWPNAYAHLDTAQVLKDSLALQETTTRLLGIEADIAARRNEQEIALLNSEAAHNEAQLRNRKALIILLGGVVLLVLILAGLLYARYRIRTRANAQLKALNQLRSRFFSNIAHEFKTPLSLIIGPLEKLLEAAEPGSEERVLYALMQRNARQLLELNDQLLDLARLEAGRMELRVRAFPVVKVFRDTAEAFRPAVSRREVMLQVDLPEGEWEMEADRGAMEKILNNLLSNALKHTPGGGFIRLRTDLDLLPDETLGETWISAHLKVRVEDSGRGIPAADIDRIFDRFYQVESARAAGTPGTGIGLALVRDLVQLMNGDIKVESKVGEGTVFSLRFPVRVRPISPEEAVRHDEAIVLPEASAHGELPRLLIVEDNEEMRSYMRQEFSVVFDVATAENGRIALELAVDDTPDIVISDLMMPEMDGLELCKALKTNPATSHVPIILLTALGTVEDRVRGLESGADDYIQKPFHPGELIARARNLVEQRRMLRRAWAQGEPIEAEAGTRSRLDEEFLEKAVAVVREHMAHPEFSVERFSREMHMSRPQLFRKLKALTDQNLTEFIRTVRLREAARLFSENFGNVTEVLYAVGFNNSSYFSKCFRELHGVSPSDYAEQYRQRQR